MINNLCGNCDGRGFHWELDGQLVTNGKTCGQAFRQGSTCGVCHGSGVDPNYWGKPLVVLAIVAVLATLSAFVIMPLLHLWLD